MTVSRTKVLKKKPYSDFVKKHVMLQENPRVTKLNN